jgi:hypothetical protein
MKSPRPPRMAGRRAAILLIRLVAPCVAERGFLSSSLLSATPVRLVDPLDRRFILLFFVSRHPEPHLSLSPRRVRARHWRFPFCTARMRRSSCLLLRRLAAPLVFLFPAPAPRGVGGAPRGALLVRSRLRSATTVLARHGTVPATGTAPVDAPPWRFTDRATTRHVSDSASDHAAPSRGRPQGQPFGSRGLPAAVAPRFRDATPRSASERLRRRPSQARMGRI